MTSNVPFLGLGSVGVSPICTWERISLLLRWLFSSEKIWASFLKVDNSSLGRTGEESGVAVGRGSGDAVGKRSHPSAPTPSPWSPAHGAPAAFQPVDGVRLQGGQDGTQRGEVPQFLAALGGRVEGVLVTPQACLIPKYDPPLIL